MIAVARRRFRPTYVYVIVSSMLTLFSFGLLGILFLAGNQLAEQLREQLEFTVILKDQVPPKEANKLCDSLRKYPWVKAAQYISKEEAARRFIEQTGEDFSDLLEYNPLFASINLKLQAAYTHPDSLIRLKTNLERHPWVSEFHYEKPVITLLHRHLRTASFVLIGISLVLLIAAVSIIDSTIRLAVYASRFLIRSMQLVGATGSFIMRPFLIRALVNGLLAALLAIGAIFLLNRFLRMQFPETAHLLSIDKQAIIFVFLLFLGILISVISTWLAVRKYLRMGVHDLY
ncbi:MAG: permease-like cell division protein FtsX [Chitinophagales bacterium]|nr:permease-like cell division protein FtsX [Chitinophagales bacterium]MDW8428782.1 permease-like cell division protein FtsX [Chitinophagales bacterium]